MGKSIIQQARGKGGPRYRVRKRAFMHKISYPMKTGEAQILELINSAGHSAPLMKLKVQDEIFHIPAFNGAVVGDKISIGETAEPKDGSILSLKKRKKSRRRRKDDARSRNFCNSCKET